MKMSTKRVSVFGCAVLAISACSIPAWGAVTDTVQVPGQNFQSQTQAIDFANAIPMPLPINTNLPPSGEGFMAPAVKGRPGFSPGSIGSGRESPTSIPKSKFVAEVSDIVPQEYGTYNHPFTTSRVDFYRNQTSRQYPARASGKLFFNIGAATYVCSASMIKKGVLVTAAHCMAGYGEQQFYSNWVYVPAQDDNVTNNAPFGTWTAAEGYVLTSWFNGSSGCNVVCPDDVGVLRVLQDAEGVWVGQKTGVLAYGWNGFSFTSFLGKSATQITQLGYPVGSDNGGVMQRTDSLGYTDTTAGAFNNTIIGTRQTGGSSGGPWIANFGINPQATPDTAGAAAGKNAVIGVTSWGYTSAGPKVQGASPFTSSNIVSLINAICPAPDTPGC